MLFLLFRFDILQQPWSFFTGWLIDTQVTWEIKSIYHINGQTPCSPSARSLYDQITLTG